MKQRINIANPKECNLIEDNSFDELRDPIALLKKGKKGQFGNDFEYIKKRGVYMSTIDSRLIQIGTQYLSNMKVLDVGCLTGIISLQAARHFNARSVVGIDIDYKMINRAVKNWVMEERRCILENQQAEQIQLNGKTILQDKLKIDSDSKIPRVLEAQTTDVLLGKRNPMDPETRNNYPNCVRFEISNFLHYKASSLEGMNEESLHNDDKFDTILCLSLLKYIHLNFSDKGLLRSFSQMNNLLRLGGHLILEFQGWKSYNKKKSFSKLFLQNISKIKIKPNDFRNILCNDFGFIFVDEIKSIREDSYKRPILIFKKLKDLE